MLPKMGKYVSTKDKMKYAANDGQKEVRKYAANDGEICINNGREEVCCRRWTRGSMLSTMDERKYAVDDGQEEVCCEVCC